MSQKNGVCVEAVGENWQSTAFNRTAEQYPVKGVKKFTEQNLIINTTVSQVT
jgi:hypothetical protein